jgi:hypothetical protein
MYLAKYKYCGASFSYTTEARPQCGAPMKYRGIVSAIVRLFVIIFLIIPVCVSVFLSVHDSITSHAISSQTQTITAE